MPPVKEEFIQLANELADAAAAITTKVTFNIACFMSLGDASLRIRVERPWPFLFSFSFSFSLPLRR
jgi:hypothetical protein